MRDDGWNAAAALLVAALTTYLGFAQGGFFAGATSIAAGALVAALVPRLVGARHPIDGLTGAGVLAIAALLGLALWTVVSASWSDSQANALMEANRTLAYLAAFTLAALIGHGAVTARWLLRLLLIAFAVLLVAGLVGRLLPDVFTPATGSIEERLAGPLGYRNALGLTAALAIVIALGLGGDDRERPIVRSLAVGVVPVAVAALYLTLSRGAMLAAVVGVVLLLVMRPGRSLAALLVTGVPTALAMVLVVTAETLTSKDATSQTAIQEGHAAAAGLAAAALLGAALLGLVIARVEHRKRPVPTLPRRVGWGIVAALVVVVAGVALLVGGTGPMERQWDRATRPTSNAPVGARAARLADPGLNGRIEHWGVSLDAFRAEPLHGTGAGTYVHEWDRERTTTTNVRDGHSLYLELLGELGVVGLVLLLTALLVPLAVVIRRRSTDAVWGAVVPVAGVWLVHAGIDWDWEMPAVTLGVFAVLGAGVAGGARAAHVARPARLLVGVLLLAVLVLPLRLGLSQRELIAALGAFQRGDCATTVDRSLGALRALNSRPQAFELLAYCDVRLGRSDLAVLMMQRAVDRDPADWELHYSAGLIRAAAGRDPRRELRLARAANPREPLVREAQDAFSQSPRRTWRRVALVQRLPGPTGRPAEER